jgi:hypothetical protein
MTRDPDIERVLDHWFTEGPTQMPTRFFDETLDRIDRAPQHRLARLQTRLLPMYPTLRFTAAAAVVLAVAGLGAVALTQTGGVGHAPPAGSGPLPAALQAQWQPVGTRELPGRSGPHPDNLDIVIGQTTTTIFDYHVDVRNAASLVGPDRIDLRAINMGWYWHCQVGDPGTYTFSLSSGDQHLTLTPGSDTCAERATILTGDWTRTHIGDLAPGRHVSAIWRPFDGGTSGQFSYAVPSGWADIDLGDTLSIIPRSNASEQAEIRLLASLVPESQDVACALIRPAAGSTPAAVAAWLANLPGLVVTSPTAVKIGGFSGVMVDVSVVPGWTNACASGRSGGSDASLGPREEASFVHTFSDSCCVGQGLESAPILVVAADLRVRYVLLDRADQQPLVIDIEAPDDPDWDRIVADAMTIVESFKFTR